MCFEFNGRSRSKAYDTRSAIRFFVNDGHINVRRPWWNYPVYIALLAIISNTTHDFLSLPRENNAKLIPKIIFEVNDASIRIDMSRSFENNLISGETEEHNKSLSNGLVKTFQFKILIFFAKSKAKILMQFSLKTKNTKTKINQMQLTILRNS